MKIRHRLTLRFIFQLAISGIIVLLIAAACTWWILQRYADMSITRDFASVGLERLVESSKLSKDGIRFDPHLLEQVKLNNGWLQSLDEHGRVDLSYNTPKDVPLSYAPGELIAYWNKTKPFPYDIYLWIQEKNGELFTIIYGIKNEMGQLLEEINQHHVLTPAGHLELPSSFQERLKKMNGYVQVLDASGTELASYNRPDSIPAQYNVQELLLRSTYSNRFGFKIASTFHEESKYTWVIGLPLSHSNAAEEQPLLSEEIRIILMGITFLFCAMFVIFLLISVWNAHRFGSPMLHMLAWIESIGQGKYTEPLGRTGQPHSRNRSGKWRRRYVVFADVMQSLHKLSAILKRDQDLQRQTNKLRDEWIAGITHDLKTPLSSIKGYAHMLTAENYEWSMAEVRKFSTTMLDKSDHMEKLINDLELSYRVNARIQPPDMEEIELNAWIEEVLLRGAVHPSMDVGRIIFKSAKTEIYVKLYPPWMERVVHNISANALLHNPPDTILTVTILHDTDVGEVKIVLEDNGAGMDDVTANRLFERYYRGTDTSSSTEGSGLGMAIAKGLVEAMGGWITVDTSLGSGTTITLVFPIPPIRLNP
ncbi:HAMP domain-containing sensor histidine kinase [Paenibacillus sp.]|uniref:sensor histidine kinase n=1 Tax=Paenibacillus sp. TaxID=58172 RepID=UPI002836A24F|nr:HAMP domain-containing sensor histidine kinase [Paenibacillus sp.]MDR0269384.1 HAMP domain-containing histidine kinase [Paenibacillus sp.]